MNAFTYGCVEWDATEEQLPSPLPDDCILRVRGKLTCPSPGYVIEVKKAQPQGVDPHQVDLELIPTAPSGPVPAVPTPVEFSYEEYVTGGYYQTVRLRLSLSKSITVIK